MKQEDKYARELIEALQEISDDERLLKAFLEDLLTPGEYKELGVRWQIVKQLAKGIPQREIAKNLSVSIATVTRGSREMLDEHGGFRKVLGKLSKEK